MTFRSRSCVIGRGVEMFSICSAIAFASKMPTQIGSTFCPSLSRRMTIGMFVMGSTINPLMVISICMVSTLLTLADSPRCQPPRSAAASVVTAPVATQRRPAVPLCQAGRAAPEAVRTRTLDANRQHAPDPRGRTGHIHDDIAARAARKLRVAPPARGVDEHLDLTTDQLLVERRLNPPL